MWALKWLSATSNVSKAEVDEMKETLEQAKKAAARDRKLPGVAMSDLTRKEVKTIFRLKELTPKNGVKPQKGIGSRTQMIHTSIDVLPATIVSTVRSTTSRRRSRRRWVLPPRSRAQKRVDNLKEDMHPI